jgi:hypothetical protein
MLVRSTIQNRPNNFIYPKAFDNGERGIFAAGGDNFRHPESSPLYKCEDSCYISISTPGNSIVFGNGTTGGDLSRTACSGASGKGRGLIMGGHSGRWPSTTVYADIKYVTISTPGNVTNFGNLTAARTYCEACSNGIRALNISGQIGTSGSASTWAWQQNVDYVTIATTANAGDFGDLISPWNGGTYGAEGDGVYAVSLSNDNSSADYLYFNISTLGNATKWGDARSGAGLGAGVNVESNSVSASNGFRGVYGGGYDAGQINHTIDYITFATPSNASQFGVWWETGDGGEGDNTEMLNEMTAVNGPGSRAVVFPSDYNPVMRYFDISTAASTSTSHGTVFGTGGTGSWSVRKNAAGFAGD